MLFTWKRTAVALGMSSASYSNPQRRAALLGRLHQFESFKCTHACRRNGAAIAWCRNRQQAARCGEAVMHKPGGRLTTGALHLTQSKCTSQPLTLRHEVQWRTGFHKYQVFGIPVVQARTAGGGGASQVHGYVTCKAFAQKVHDRHEDSQSSLCSPDSGSITSDSQEESGTPHSADVSESQVPEVKGLALVPPGEKGTPPGPRHVSGTSPSGGTSSDRAGVPECGFWQRTRGALTESASAAYSTFVDNTLISLLTFLRVGQLLAWLTPELKNTYALLTGVLHSMTL